MDCENLGSFNETINPTIHCVGFLKMGISVVSSFNALGPSVGSCFE